LITTELGAKLHPKCFFVFLASIFKEVTSPWQIRIDLPSWHLQSLHALHFTFLGLDEVVIKKTICEPRGRQFNNLAITAKLSNGRRESIKDGLGATVGVALKTEGKLVKDDACNGLAS
jgi:hypothetical protein